MSGVEVEAPVTDKNMKRTLIALCAMFFAIYSPAEAQQPKKIPRVGFLAQRVSPTPNSPHVFADAIRQGLRDLGYIEGKNILVDYRYGEGKRDRLQAKSPNSCNSRSMCLSLDNCLRSTQLSRRPRRFPL